MPNLHRWQRQVNSPLTDNLEEAMTWVEESKAKGEAKSIGLIGNAADVFPELVARGAKLADIPIEQASKFIFAFNQPAAASLGLTVSPLVMASVDELIE